MKIIRKIISGFKLIRNKLIGMKYAKCGTRSYLGKTLKVVGAKYIYIGDRVFSNDGLRIEAVDSWEGVRFSPTINIGNDSVFGQNCHITCANSIQMEHDVVVMPNVLITDIEHQYRIGINTCKTGLTVGSIVIKAYVSIGYGACIFGKNNITIGRNAVIGANAIITKSVPERAIVVGNNRIIGYVE